MKSYAVIQEAGLQVSDLDFDMEKECYEGANEEEGLWISIVGYITKLTLLIYFYLAVFVRTPVNMYVNVFKEVGKVSNSHSIVIVSKIFIIRCMLLAGSVGAILCPKSVTRESNLRP
jgi:hypothetical protein